MDGDVSDLKGAVEDALRMLAIAQAEIYEGLKRDSFPRFTLTPVWAELNKVNKLKQTLATEKLEDEAAKTTAAPVVRRKSESGPVSLGVADKRSSDDLSSNSTVSFGRHMSTLAKGGDARKATLLRLCDETQADSRSEGGGLSYSEDEGGTIPTPSPVATHDPNQYEPVV